VHGSLAGEVGEGNRKDVRNAVEAAHGATAWAKASAHGRAQVLYYFAENLEARAGEFATRIESLTGADGEREVHAAVARLFYYAGWCDKFEGAVHHPPSGRVVFAMPEPIGVMGVVCPDVAPLLGLVSMVAPALAMGNTVIAIPSERAPLVATDLYQVLDTSDVPAGAVNIITGSRTELAVTLGAQVIMRWPRRWSSYQLATSSRPGLWRQIVTGLIQRLLRVGHFCAGRPRSRTCGCPTVSEVFLPQEVIRKKRDLVSCLIA
jgi:acyl-CoA reductase-like NAD-dependent aldehyde dehydrogenase